MTISGLPLPYNIAALGIAIMDPCTGMAKNAALNKNGVLCTNTTAFDLDPQTVGGDELTSETADGKLFRGIMLPKDVKYAKGNLKVGVFHPEVLALIEGAELYTNTGITRGWSERPVGGTQQYIWLQAYERLDYGSSCPAAGSPLYRVHILPYVQFQSKPVGMKKGYREAEAEIIAYPLIPAKFAAATPSGTLASGSPNVTVASTTGLGVGQTVTGTGVPAGATIASITSATVFVLSANATATGAQSLTIAAGGYVGPFGDIPSAYWPSFTKPSFRYVLDIAAPPANYTACDTAITVI